MNSAERKRKLVPVAMLKSILHDWGFPTTGKKAKLQETVDRLKAMKTLSDNATIDHHWTKDEMDIFFSGLSIDDYDRWQPQEVCLVQQLVNARFVSAEVLNIPYYAKMMAKIAEYCNFHFSSIPRLKDQTVTADSLSPLFRLLKKNVEKWDDADGDLLLQYIGNVAKVDVRTSTPGAIEKYCELLAKLAAFYLRRPDIKAKVDPELVIFDVTAAGVNINTYNVQLAAYALPAHFGPMPAHINPGPVGIVFPMPNLAAANHFIGCMMGTVPSLRATLQPGAPGGILIY